jgi:MoxR-like ATPase
MAPRQPKAKPAKSTVENGAQSVKPATPSTNGVEPEQVKPLPEVLAELSPECRRLLNLLKGLEELEDELKQGLRAPQPPRPPVALPADQQPLKLSPQTANLVVQELSRAVRGHEERVRVFVASQVLGLPTLLIGSHGTGKTRLVKAFAKMLCYKQSPVKAFMMLLKSSHKPVDVFYSYDLPALMCGEEKIVPKAIDADLVFLDEVFANELVLSALKDFLEERVYDRYRAKWLFFVAGTNPPNDFYQNVLVQRNMADLDRFDVVIPMTPPKSVVLSEVLDVFDEAKTRENEYTPRLKVDVSEISKTREEILTTVRLSQGAKAYLLLMSLAFSACYYHDEVGGGKSRADRFSVLERLPCERCTYKKFALCRYALSPMRFARSATLLAKALAWMDGHGKADVSHVRVAVKYTLPLRLVATREEVKLSAPTLESFVEQAVRDFEAYCFEAVQSLKTMLKNVLALGSPIYASKTEEPVLKSVFEDLSQVAESVKRSILAAIPTIDDASVLEALSRAGSADVAQEAGRRLEEVRGVKAVTLTDVVEVKRLLKELFVQGYVDARTFSEKVKEVDQSGSFSFRGEGLVVEPLGEGGGVRVRGKKEVVEKVVKKPTERNGEAS